MIASWIISRKLKNKFKAYSQISLSSNLSGNEIAQLMLRDNNISDVQIISVDGQLTDHYNPDQKTVNLSADVFHGRSAVSAAVAAHECGHVVQHQAGYKYLNLRSALVPIQNVSAKVINFVFLSMFWEYVYK